MDKLKTFLQSKIDEYIAILRIEMTKENVNEITYGDKLCALGGLNMAVAVMKEIDPDFHFDLFEFFPEVKEKERNYSRSSVMLLYKI